MRFYICVHLSAHCHYFFSQVTKSAKNFGGRLVEFELTVANLQPSAYTTGPMADSDIPLIRDDARTETGNFFFLQIEGCCGFPHYSNYRTTKKKVRWALGLRSWALGISFAEKTHEHCAGTLDFSRRNGEGGLHVVFNRQGACCMAMRRWLAYCC